MPGWRFDSDHDMQINVCTNRLWARSPIKICILDSNVVFIPPRTVFLQTRGRWSRFLRLGAGKQFKVQCFTCSGRYFHAMFCNQEFVRSLLSQRWSQFCMCVWLTMGLQVKGCCRKGSMHANCGSQFRNKKLSNNGRITFELGTSQHYKNSFSCQLFFKMMSWNSCSCIVRSNRNFLLEVPYASIVM